MPGYVVREFEDYLKCGRFEHGFLRLQCESSHHEKLVALSCNRRSFCPSCGARRMADCAAHLVDEVLPKRPVRQWVMYLQTLEFLLKEKLRSLEGEVVPRVLTVPLCVIYLEDQSSKLMCLFRWLRHCFKPCAQNLAYSLIKLFWCHTNSLCIGQAKDAIAA